MIDVGYKKHIHTIYPEMLPINPPILYGAARVHSRTQRPKNKSKEATATLSSELETFKR